MTRRVGIDLGATAVRVVEVNGLDGDSAARITKASIVPLQPGAIVAGRIQDPVAVGWALTRALKAAKASGYGAVLGVSGGESALTRLSMPAALKPTEWVDALRVADRQISPRVPLADASVSLYPVPDPSDLDNPMQRTLLAAATIDGDVDQVMAVARRAKVTPRAMDLSAAAMVRAMTRSVHGVDDVGTLVDIGYSKVTVATRQGLHLRSVRTFEGGGERITRAIMGATGTSYDAAEEAKLTMRLAGGVRQSSGVLPLPSLAPAYGASTPGPATHPAGLDPAQDALTASVGVLIEEIAAAVEVDAAAHPNRPTQGLVLCGGTSLLRGLKDQLVQRVGVPAFVGRPWARVTPSAATRTLFTSPSPDAPSGMEDPVILLSLATAVGLAIWEDPR